MKAPVINETLIESYEINFGKGKTVINEYAPSISKCEIKLNRMALKKILAEIFDKSKEAGL